MHTCQTIANYSSYSILSCSNCLEQCDTLYNHSAFCILECHGPTTTTAIVTTPLATTPTTTTPIATTLVTTPIVTTTVAATTFAISSTTKQTTTAIKLTTTPNYYDNIFTGLKTYSSNKTNNNTNEQNLAVDVTKNTITPSQDVFFFVLFVIPVIFLICFLISFLCRRKRSLVRKKSRTVLPLDANEVAIDINHSDTIVTQKRKDITANDMIIKTVVASVVSEIVEKIVKNAKLPSVSDAAQTLKGLRLVKRKLLRQRQKREQGIQQLVLQNMQRQKKGMRIKEIFKNAPDAMIKNNFDVI